jgi:putative membrane protein
MTTRTRRAIACTAGFAVIAIAQFSALDREASRLFAAHMTQHLLLMLVAPPLLVWGRAHLLLLRALPPEWRPVLHRTGRRLDVARHPLAAWTLFAGALWGWHLPEPYQAALRVPWVHAAEHLCFFGTSVLWWACLVGRRRIAHAPAMVFVFTTMLHGAWLAALLTFAPRVLYPFYATRAEHYGLTPLQDQQLAGVIMWIPPGILYVSVIVVLFFGWFGVVEARVRRSEAAAVRGP